MERTASRFDRQRSRVRVNSSRSGKVSALLLLVFHLLVWQPVPAFPQEPQSPDIGGGLTDAATQGGDQDQNRTDGGIADDYQTSTTGLPTSGQLEEATDIGEHHDAKHENGLSSLGAAATGESGTLQPAIGQSAVKQVIPEPDPTTGALIYSYPLTVPPGRNGLAPDLKLTYNSQDSQKDSYLGNRWSLNIPSIERLNKTGTERIYDENFFASSLSGELALVSGMAYAPKVENGDFLKYSYDGTSWTATDKRGTVYRFGAQGSTRQDDPSDVAKVYRWMLEEVRDTNGNFITCTYFKDTGQIYPETITYTGNGSTSGIFQVSFERGNYDSKRPSLYYPSFPVKTAYLVTGITMSVNSAWVRKYDLGYVTGDQGYRALLGSITESGRDEATNTVTSLPATTFAYKTRGPLGWDQASTWQMPLAFVGTSESNMLQIQDVNGDTYPDVVYSERNQGEAVYLSNTVDGWSPNDASWPFPIWIKNTTGYKDHGTRIVDVNGDLLADIVQSLSESSGGSPITGSAYLNSGNPTTGWTQDFSISIPAGFVYGTSMYADDAVRIADVNGDGLADLLRSFLDDDSRLLEQQVYLSNGSGWVAAPPGTWQVPFPFIDENPSGPEIYTFAQIVDVNGDDLPDIMWRYSDIHFWWIPYSVEANLVFMNNGHGWEPSDFEKWRAPMAFEWGERLKAGSTDLGVRATDINGDGLQDVFWAAFTGASSFAGYAYLNSGRESPFPYTLESLNVPDGLATHNQKTNPKVQLADVNADGLDDFVHSDRSTFSVFVTHTELAKPNSFTDLLTSVTAPIGGTYTISYKLSNKYRNVDQSLLNPKLPLVLPTVERITVTDPVTGASGSSTWSYKDGFYYYASSTDRRLAGFGEITKTDPAGNLTKTFYHQGNASNTSQGEWNDHPAKIGKPYRTEQYDGAGKLYATTVNRWDKSNLGAGRDFVKLAWTTTSIYDAVNSRRDTATEYAYDNANGNVTQKTEWGDVSASPDGSFSDGGTDKAVETFSYAANSSSYVVGLPSRDTVVDQDGNMVRETKTYYDNLPFGSIGAGNPTKSEQWVTGTTYVSSQKAYNTTFGTVVSTTDPRGKATSFAYDSFNFYPTTITNPLGHAVSYVYDYSSGKTTQLTDQNGFTYQTLYDGLDRVTEERQPDLANPASLVTKTAYTYTDTAGAVKVKRSNFLDAANIAESYQYFDGLGRLVQERKEAEVPGSFNVKDTAWNLLGLVERQSLPYAGSGSARTPATATASLYMSYTYDAIQRPLTVTDATGTMSYTYEYRKITATDKNGKVKRSQRDAFGNLSRAEEVNGLSLYVTFYKWNLNGKLLSLIDELRNVRNFSYDGLGRRLSAQDLHVYNDATFGTWTYAYDEAGNLMQKLSPNAQTTHYAYNDVNQQVSEDHAGGTGTEITYTYGGCTNGIGKLCSVSMLSGANSSYTYDALGNLASETRTIAGISYVTVFTYDRQGNTVAITYPDSAETRYSFNGAGLLERIERRENGGNFVNVVSRFDYAPAGQVSFKEFGNGVTTRYTYDPTKLYRLTNLLTASPVSGSSGAVTSTFYPDPGTAGPTGSATLERATNFIGEQVWSSLRAGAGTYASSTDNPNRLAGMKGGISMNQWVTLSRAIFSFDTSAIPDNDIITSATFSLYGSAKSDGGIRLLPDINLYEATAASSYNFTTANFAQMGAVPLSTAITYAGWSTTGYNRFVLNAAGLANISKTGVTKFGTRNAKYDAANVTPIWSENAPHFLQGYLSQEAGTAKDPMLVVVHAAPSPPIQMLQDIDFSYDAVGNIILVQDRSGTVAAKTAVYTYDDLHRLTSATITNAANGANYTDTYAYNAIGNITSGPAGVYLYQGNTGSLTANPHAATSVNGAANVYDNDGNLLENANLHNSWNYRDELVQTVTALTTVTYLYDHGGNRVSYAEGGASTFYPNKHFTTEGGKKTKQIYAGDELVATIETAGAVVTPYYVHVDHLGSTNAVSDSAGALAQTLDYYPFGAQRLSSGTYNEERQYIGQIYDTDTRLDYLNARYYEGGRGQFLSEDPAHLSVGDAERIKHITGQELETYLANPQLLNSYSYAVNNPIRHSDPTGNATYIWENGVVAIGADTWNSNSYHESQDRELVNSNASLGEANRGNIKLFVSHVRPGGSWDYKRNTDNRGFYFFNGNLISAEEFGNANYGYSGTAFGFGEDMLTDAAGAVQILTAGRDNDGPTLGNISGNFDDPRDTTNIRLGVSVYNSAGRLNSTAGLARATNMLYNASVACVIQGLSAATAALGSLSQKIKQHGQNR
jgi:RHS repeat-associated protein